MKTFSLGHPIGLVVGFLIVAAMTSPALGQSYGATHIDDDDLAEYTAILRLSEGQTRAMEARYQAYMERWNTWIEEERLPFERRMRGGVAGDDRENRATREEIARTLPRLADQAARLDASFFDDLLSMLTDEQLDRVDIARLLRERDRMLVLCKIGPIKVAHQQDYDVGLDLRRELRKVEPTRSERKAIEPVLHDYESKLTSRLKDYYQAVFEHRWHPRREPRHTLEDIRRSKIPVVKVGAPVFRLHRQFMDRILPLLSPQRASALRDHATLRLYGGLEPDPKRVHRLFDRIELDRLPNEQAQAIGQLRRDYESRHLSVSQRIWDIIDDTADDYRRWAAGSDIVHDSDRDIRRLVEQRAGLNAQTMRELGGLLGSDALIDIAITLERETGSGFMEFTSRLEPVTVRFEFGDAAIARELNLDTPFVWIRESIAREFPELMLRLYERHLLLNARQSATLHAAAAELNHTLKRLEYKFSARWEAAAGLWIADGGERLLPPSREVLANQARTRDTLIAETLAADNTFLDAIEAVLDEQQLVRMPTVRGAHHHYRMCSNGPPVLIVASAAVAPGFSRQFADPRFLLFLSDLTHDQWRSVQPALDAFGTRARVFYEQLYEHASSGQRVCNEIIRSGGPYEGKDVTIDLYPNTPNGRVFRKSIVDYIGTYREMDALYEECRAQLRETLDENTYQRFEDLFNQRMMYGRIDDTPEGHPKVLAALRVDDLTGSQRQQIGDLHVTFLAEKDAYERKRAELFKAGGLEAITIDRYRFRDDGTVYEVPQATLGGTALTEYNAIGKQINDLRDRMVRELRFILNDQQEHAIGIAEAGR